MDVKGKNVLITGAGSGIGKAIAKAFVAKGAKVTVFGQHKPEDVACEFFKVDVSKEKEVIANIEKIQNLDVLVNNAGIAKLSRIEGFPEKDFNDMIGVNFKGVFLMSKYGIPKFNAGGCIVNIGSIAAFRIFEEYGIYSATKAAVVNLTKTLALELSEKKIRVNSVSPGAIDTEIWNKMYGDDGKKELEETTKLTPTKRAGKPEEVANAVVFLCENDFVNGGDIVVDGGQTLE